MKIEWTERITTEQMYIARVGDYDIWAKRITEEEQEVTEEEPSAKFIARRFIWGIRNHKTNRLLDSSREAKSLADAKRKVTAAVEKRLGK